MHAIIIHFWCKCISRLMTSLRSNMNYSYSIRKVNDFNWFEALTTQMIQKLLLKSFHNQIITFRFLKREKTTQSTWIRVVWEICKAINFLVYIQQCICVHDTCKLFEMKIHYKSFFISAINMECVYTSRDTQQTYSHILAHVRTCTNTPEHSHS